MNRKLMIYMIKFTIVITAIGKFRISYNNEKSAINKIIPLLISCFYTA